MHVPAEAHAFKLGSQFLAVGVIGILHVKVKIPQDGAIARTAVIRNLTVNVIIGSLLLALTSELENTKRRHSLVWYTPSDGSRCPRSLSQAPSSRTTLMVE